MITNNDLTTLNEKIAQYLELNETELTFSITSRILQLLQENVNFDYQKLIYAIESFYVLKNSGSTLNYQDKENKLDISIGDTNIKVKGFTSKGKPALYFFINDEPKAFFKIKTKEDDNGKNVIVEMANNSYVLDDYKKGIYHNELSYVHQEKFSILNGKLANESTIKSFVDGKGELVVDPMFFCDDYLNFYRLINLVLENNNQKKLTKITPSKADLFFCQMYQTMKNVTSKKDEFSFSELVLLIDTVVNDGKSCFSELSKMDNTIERSDFAPMLDNIRSLHNGINKRNITKMDFNISTRNGERVLKTVSADRYMSIDIYSAETGEKLTSYIIGMTDRGFTLFKNASLDDSDVKRMMTFNVSDNILKLHIDDKYDAEKEFSNLDMIMQIHSDGGLTLDSISKYLCAESVELENNLENSIVEYAQRANN